MSTDRSHASPPGKHRPAIKVVLVVCGAWIAMAVLETAKTYASLRASGVARPLAGLFLFNLPWWAGWAVLTWPAVVIARRLPIHDAKARARAIGIHALVACVAAAAHVAATSAIYYSISGGNALRVANRAELIGRWMNTFFIADVLTYAGIVGVFYAVQYAGHYRQSLVDAAAMEAERERLQRRMVEARLHALQRELDPHFLFNTLNAIGALVRRQDPQEALQMLAKLGDLLRDALARGDRFESSLEEELASLQRYLDIERARFGERLRVVTHVPADLRGVLLPTFSLQPLVENAIRHGIAQTTEAGFVSLEAFADNGRVMIRIRNTGASPAATVREGIGLSNTRARLAQMYGNAAGLDFAIADDGEATATLWAPLHTAPVLISEHTES